MCQPAFNFVLRLTFFAASRLAEKLCTKNWRCKFRYIALYSAGS